MSGPLRRPTEPACLSAGSRPFVKLRDLTLAAAAAGRLRKHGGRVWRPVPGCPCAYVMAESFRDFLNATLEADPTYNSRCIARRCRRS